MKQLLKLKGKTAVFVDWANVHGWEEKLKWEIDLERLYQYLKSYHRIKEFRFYFGTDVHPASKEQIRAARKIGFFVVTKVVKYLPVKDKNIVIWKRKCDFDLEIGLDCFEMLERFDGFIFFSGDGDMATLYQRLVKRGKQVIIIAASGTLGREITQIKKGVYILKADRLRNFISKKIPPDRDRGRD